jgi:hypothetical protein
MIRVTAAGVRLLLDRLDPHQAHQTSHPLAVDRPTIVGWSVGPAPPVYRFGSPNGGGPLR